MGNKPSPQSKEEVVVEAFGGPSRSSRLAAAGAASLGGGSNSTPSKTYGGGSQQPPPQRTQQEPQRQQYTKNNINDKRYISNPDSRFDAKAEALLQQQPTAEDDSFISNHLVGPEPKEPSQPSRREQQIKIQRQLEEKQWRQQQQQGRQQLDCTQQDATPAPAALVVSPDVINGRSSGFDPDRFTRANFGIEAATPVKPQPEILPFPSPGGSAAAPSSGNLGFDDESLMDDILGDLGN